MQIDRIQAPSAADFKSKFMKRRRPVIIEGMFAADPLSHISSLNAARCQLGLTLLEIQQEYSRQFGGIPRKPKRLLTLAEYLDFVEQNPATDEMCTEFPLPEAIATLFKLPVHCRSDSTLRQLLLLGNAGNFAALHFDSDLRHVFLMQVFGRKRIFLIPPHESPKLWPDTNFSRVCMHHLTDDEKDSFATYAGGYPAVVIGPGDTLYIPPLFWHYIEYVDTAMSIALRFGRNRYCAFLAEHVHMDAAMQQVAGLVLDESEITPATLQTLEQFRRICADITLTPEQKYAAINALVKDVLAERRLERQVYVPSFFARPEDRTLLYVDRYRHLPQ